MSVHVVARRRVPGIPFTHGTVRLNVPERVLPWITSLPRVLLLLERLNYHFSWKCLIFSNLGRVVARRDVSETCFMDEIVHLDALWRILLWITQYRGCHYCQSVWIVFSTRSVHVVAQVETPWTWFTERIIYYDPLQRILPWIAWKISSAEIARAVWISFFGLLRDYGHQQRGLRLSL